MDIGEHCSFSQCNRLDFLPFTCEQCQLIFCKDHRLPPNHACQFESIVSSHGTEKQQFLFRCSLPVCKKRDVTEVKCVHCEGSFCIEHRHQEDHNCPALLENKRQSVSLQKRERKIVALQSQDILTAVASKSVKDKKSSSATRAKVALMSLKLKAVGFDSTPQGERVYYEVRLPSCCGLPNTPMFFSMEWSVGRMVDYIAKKFKLRNENGKAHSEKLLLFNSKGVVLPMSVVLRTLVETDIPNGSSINLEYEDRL